MSRSLNLCHFGHEKFTLPRAAMVVVVKRFFIMYARPSTNARPHMPSFHTIQTRSFFLRGSNILRGHTNQNRRLTFSSSLVAAPGLGSSSPENASSASSLIDQPPNHNPACQTTSAAHPDFIFKDSIQTSFTQLLSFNKKFPLSPQVLIQIAR